MREDYLSKYQCNCVKGFFVLWVVARHFSEYVEQVGGISWDLRFGQMIVTMFLFYSGYGVMEAIRNKGFDYVKRMPVHRCLNTYLNFVVAVCIYIAVNLLLGNKLTVHQCLLSFVFWDSCGNSTWYIFSIIVCYALAFVSARVTVRRCRWRIPWIALFLTSMAVVGMTFIRPFWWYDTMLCFPVGMIYSQYRNRLEDLIGRWYCIALIISMGAYFVFRNVNVFAKGIVPNLMAVSFALTVLILTMKVCIRSNFLAWCGERVFPIYIYQRIPMLILFTLFPNCFKSLPWCGVFLVLAYAVTLLIAKCFHRIEVKL